ncbi:MAG: flagellar assembly protein A [Pseudomonadota bacterium]
MSNLEDRGILIVDDEEVILNILRRLLKKQGFSKIITALNTGQAVKILQGTEKPFFMVISDQFMPGMSGTDFLAQVFSLSPDTRRILMTGFADAAIVVEAINKGAIHRFIPKPWDNIEIIAIILSELEQYEKIQEKKRLHNITSGQNAQLFRYAKVLQAKEKLFTQEIDTRTGMRDHLKVMAENLSADQQSGPVLPGLNDLIARSVIISPQTLEKSFKTLETQITQIFNSLAQRAQIPFDPCMAAGESGSAIPDDDEIYSLMDRIINQAGRAAAPALETMDQPALSHGWVDAYDQVPDLLELAMAEGCITREAAEAARTDMAGLPENGPSCQRFLLDSEMISRKDLSRILVKKSLIQTRLKDREYARRLVENGSATAREIEKLMVRQMNRFQDTGECVSLSEMLLEEKGELTAPGPDGSRDGSFSYTPGMKDRMPDAGSLSPSQAVEITVSDDKTRAFIQVPQAMIGRCTVESIRDILNQRNIRYGIVDEKLLEGFLKYATDPEKKFVVAMGLTPDPGKHARISYFFDTHYQTAGIVAEDGTIDFRDRGEIPFVKEDALLAEKLPLVPGRMGRDIYGDPIPVDEVDDRVLKPGPGTRISEDGLKLYATVAGQPSLDNLGTVSVFKELVIRGDVDFETGHVDFHGNVMVYGIVKEGFRVTCVDLTANEIHGGQIELTGDLNVSTGIVNAKVKVMGRVQAKFINNATISAFDDVIVMREIMGSEIVTGGALINAAGRITASTVAAKKGMSLGQVGTERSLASTLRTGVNDYLADLTGSFDRKIETMDSQRRQCLAQRKELEERNFAMHKEVADQSFTQEKMLRSLEALKKQCLDLKGRKDAMIANLKEIKKVEQALEDSDKIIKNIFQAQDQIMKTTEGIEKQILGLGLQLDDLRLEKEAIQEIAALEKGVPEVRVSKRIVSGTRIFGPQSSLIIRTSQGACRIVEMASTDPEAPHDRQLVIQAVQ